jgi:hypothetical protein
MMRLAIEQTGVQPTSGTKREECLKCPGVRDDELS